MEESLTKSANTALECMSLAEALLELDSESDDSIFQVRTAAWHGKRIVERLLERNYTDADVIQKITNISDNILSKTTHLAEFDYAIEDDDSDSDSDEE